MTIYSALADRTTVLGDRPAVAFLDAATGERTELGFTTLHNWVSKTANLLLDVFDVGPGAEVAIDAPLHWLVPVLALGTWSAGGAVRIGRAGDVVIGHEADGTSGLDIVVGAGLAGRPTTTDVGDALTTTDILAQPDDFVDDPGDDGAWAIGARTQATLLAEVLAVDSARILHAGDRTTEQTLLLIARTLPAGTGLVLASGFDASGLQAVAAQEDATAQP